MVPRLLCLSAVSLALIAPGVALAQDADPVDATDVTNVTGDPTLDLDATTVSDDSGADDASCDADDASADAADSDDVADRRVAAIRQDADDDSADADDADSDAADDDSDYADEDDCDDDSDDTPVATGAVVSKLPKLSFSRLVAGRSVALGTVTVPRSGRVVQKLMLRGAAIGSVTRTVGRPGPIHLSLKLSRTGRIALRKTGARKARLTLRTTLAASTAVTTTVVLKRS